MFENKKLLLFTFAVITLPFLAFYTIEYFDGHHAQLPVYGPVQTADSGETVEHTVQPFQFLNQDSVLTSLADFDNQLMVVNYFFTSCPTICPSMTRSMQRVRESFLKTDPLALVSLTVDPARDQPARLRRYAEKYNADWTFLTGEKKALYALARNGFFLSATEGDGGPHDFIHSEKLVLLDLQRRIRGYYDGTDTEAVNQLILDIIKLKKEL